MWMSIEAILVQLTLFHAFFTHTSTKHILYKYELLTFKKIKILIYREFAI